MSFLKIPFSRLKPSSSSPNDESTEMTQVFDLDSFIALVDSRHILENEQDNSSEDDNDDQSSISSASTNIHTMNQHGVKYHYEDDEDDEENTPFVGDEAEQSLVSGRDHNSNNSNNDVESGIIKQKVVAFLKHNKRAVVFIFQ
ncbi:hypothetical protein MAM1_0333d09776 [Mucor ambiguus]|uniref:Uncharacterized protein n=1 Tax=Mucor ambiguus TaxID=91626 RepID=A0A0C9N6P3_9FUNG|nr:hypothetical protein MAM1_0333d09776 [Mucor ambiguus]